MIGGADQKLPPFSPHTAYVFRLCLEYARLAADNRDAMDFKY